MFFAVIASRLFLLAKPLADIRLRTARVCFSPKADMASGIDPVIFSLSETER
jgi:hypothetical protein